MPEQRRNGQHRERRSLNVFDSVRMPPFNPEIEEGIIGSVLTEPTPKKLLDDPIVAGLKSEHFFRDGHQIVWRAILEMWARGVEPEPLALADILQREGTFDKAGGLDAFERYCRVAHSQNGREYAARVLQDAMNRAGIEMAQALSDACYSRDKTAVEVVELAETLVTKLAVGVSTNAASKPASSVIGSALAKIAARRAGELVGLGTPFRRLDEITGGLSPGSTFVIAARPSAGKTALALRFCEHFASLGKFPLFVSLEQGEEEIGLRLLSMRARVTLSKVANPQFCSRGETEDLGNAIQFFKDHPVEIADSPDLTPSTIAATVRRLVRSKGIGAVVVDYLQIMRMDDGSSKNRQEQVAEAMATMKRTARSVGVPFLVLSQLSRRIEEREDKVPQLSDLRDSGAIEQDADIVAFIHRPEIYNTQDRPGEADLVIRKNRNGPTTTIPLTFVGPTMRFEARADRPEPDHGGEPF